MLNKREKAKLDKLKAQIKELKEKAQMQGPIKLSRNMVKKIGTQLAKHRTIILTLGKGVRVSIFTRETHAVRVKHGKNLGSKNKREEHKHSAFAH